MGTETEPPFLHTKVYCLAFTHFNFHKWFFFFFPFGDSVADFWGWDAHEVQLRCPNDVSGDMQEDETPGGALRLNLLTTQTMVTTGIFPCKEKFPW